ncbi:MAG: hypothetical protein A2539_08890 [Elusimicrobia bacterium RIFOXYD2_FULL_34_15]|nr:MAG: hypothetical protein A2539_08890 [Elusimicrobia bacterium RIFOXYD2_FULL_34_15]
MKIKNKKIRISIIILQLTAVFLFSSLSYAQEKPDSSYKENLKRWQSLSEEERQVIRERAKKISPEQLKELKEKSVKFKSMSKEEQDKIKNNYQRFEQFPPEKKEILKERHRRFEELSPENREKLRNEFRKRRNMSLGDSGADLKTIGKFPNKKTDTQFSKKDSLIKPEQGRPVKGKNYIPKGKKPANFGENIRSRRKEEINDNREKRLENREQRKEKMVDVLEKRVERNENKNEIKENRKNRQENRKKHLEQKR